MGVLLGAGPFRLAQLHQFLRIGFLMAQRIDQRAAHLFFCAFQFRKVEIILPRPCNGLNQLNTPHHLTLALTVKALFQQWKHIGAHALQDVGD